MFFEEERTWYNLFDSVTQTSIKDWALNVLGINDKTISIGGFHFDFSGDIKINQTNNITTNMTENNQSISDNIALLPTTITIEGWVGECFVDRANEEGELLKTGLNVAKTVSSIASIIPAYTPEAQKIVNNTLNTAEYAYNLAKQSLKALSGTSYQKQAFAYTRYLRDKQKTISVNTPYQLFTNMVIKTVDWEQSAETEDYSHCVITLQQFFQYQVQTQKFDISNPCNVIGKTKSYFK